jgi:hypothetical protein
VQGEVQQEPSRATDPTSAAETEADNSSASNEAPSQPAPQNGDTPAPERPFEGPASDRGQATDLPLDSTFLSSKDVKEQPKEAAQVKSTTTGAPAQPSTQAPEAPTQAQLQASQPAPAPGTIQPALLYVFKLFSKK